MKLLTKKIRKRLPKLYQSQNDKDPVLQVKFFTPWTIVDLVRVGVRRRGPLFRARGRTRNGMGLLQPERT